MPSSIRVYPASNFKLLGTTPKNEPSADSFELMSILFKVWRVTPVSISMIFPLSNKRYEIGSSGFASKFFTWRTNSTYFV